MLQSSFSSGHLFIFVLLRVWLIEPFDKFFGGLVYRMMMLGIIIVVNTKPGSISPKMNIVSIISSCDRFIVFVLLKQKLQKRREKSICKKTHHF